MHRAESSILVLLDVSVALDKVDQSILLQSIGTWFGLKGSAHLSLTTFSVQIPHLMFPISVMAFLKGQSWVCYCSPYTCYPWVM